METTKAAEPVIDYEGGITLEKIIPAEEWMYSRLVSSEAKTEMIAACATSQVEDELVYLKAATKRYLQSGKYDISNCINYLETVEKFHGKLTAEIEFKSKFYTSRVLADMKKNSNCVGEAIERLAKWQEPKTEGRWVQTGEFEAVFVQ